METTNNTFAFGRRSTTRGLVTRSPWLAAGAMAAMSLSAMPASAVTPSLPGAGSGVPDSFAVQVWWGASQRSGTATPIDWSGSVSSGSAELAITAVSDFDAHERLESTGRDTIAWVAQSVSGRDGIRFIVTPSVDTAGSAPLLLTAGGISLSVSAERLGCEPVQVPHPTAVNQSLWISRQCDAQSVNPELAIEITGATRRTSVALYGASLADGTGAGQTTVRGFPTTNRTTTIAVRANTIATAPFAWLCIDENGVNDCFRLTDLACGTQQLQAQGHSLTIAGECPADGARAGVFFPNADLFSDPATYPSPKEFNNRKLFPYPGLFLNTHYYPSPEVTRSPVD